MTRVSVHLEVGRQYGQLTVLEVGHRLPLTPGRARQRATVGARAALVECSCGVVKLMDVISIASGQSVSCGHHKLVTNRKDGRSAHASYTRWENMMQRCYNQRCPEFKRYGARGIGVWPQWHDSRVFLDYLDTVLGSCPAGHSLDRIDNSKGYRPGNIRWADATTQTHNTRPKLRAVV